MLLWVQTTSKPSQVFTLDCSNSLSCAAIRIPPASCVRFGWGLGTAPLEPLALALRDAQAFCAAQRGKLEMPEAALTAVELTETLVLTDEAFRDIFTFRPDAYRHLMVNIAQDLSRRLRAANARTAEYVRDVTA